MEFLFTLESLGLSFMEIRLGANGIGARNPFSDAKSIITQYVQDHKTE